MNKQTQDYRKMPIVHQQVASIDIGSQFHVVAVGDDPKQDVQQFGVSTKELFRLADWLREHDVKHVALEATGGYERPLVNVLQEASFDVLVTAGANTKNYRRFKSDTSDAIHIRTLHSLGLLPPIFLPDEFSTLIRPLVRLRKSLVDDYIRRIQKALRAGNVRLDTVLTDTNSVSGLRIVYVFLLIRKNTIAGTLPKPAPAPQPPPPPPVDKEKVKPHQQLQQAQLKIALLEEVIRIAHDEQGLELPKKVSTAPADRQAIQTVGQNQQVTLTLLCPLLKYHPAVLLRLLSSADQTRF